MAPIQLERCVKEVDELKRVDDPKRSLKTTLSSGIHGSSALDFRLKVGDDWSEEVPYVRSPPHRVGNCSVCLRVYPRGTGTCEGKAVSAFLEVLPDVLWSPAWSVPGVRYTIVAVNSGSFLSNIVRSDTFSFDGVRSLRGWENMIPHTSPAELHRAGWLTPEGEVWLRATAEGGFGRDQPLEPGLSGTKLLWADRKWTDMTIAAEDGERISCHRAVLASQSPVFDRMFCSNLCEARDGHVIVHDVTAAVLHAFVAFFYTGALPVGADVVALLRLADMYEVPRLSALCMTTLMRSTSGATVAQTLQTLRLHGASNAGMARHYRSLLSEVTKKKCWLHAVAKHLVEEGDESVLRGVAERVLADPTLSETVFGPLIQSLHEQREGRR